MFFSVCLVPAPKTLFSFTSDSVIDLPTQEGVSEHYEFGDIEIDDFNEELAYTLEQLIMENPIAASIAEDQGIDIPFPPEGVQITGAIFNIISMVDIGATQIELDEFSEISFITGDLNIGIENTLPINIESLEIDLSTGVENENVGLFQEAIQEKATNPFFKIAFPKAKQILISSIRDLRKTLYLKSYIQGRKTVLIFDAHLLSIGQGAAGNALLKILEEPPNNTTLILVTDYKEQLLPTLSSRCQQVNFPPLDPEVMTLYLEKMGISSELVPVVIEISQGNMHRAYSLLDKSTENILVMIKDMVVSIFTEDGSNWRQFINEYSRLALNDPQKFIFKFHLLQLWLRSAYREKLGLSSDISLVGLDEGSLSLVQKLREIDFLRIDTYLEEILNGMTRNLNTSITLTNLLIKLHREMNEGRLYG